MSEPSAAPPAPSGLAILTHDSPVPLVSTLMLSRADARNALSIELLHALHARVDELGAMLAAPAGSTTPRVLVLTGAGKSFCSGMDLKQVLAHPDNPLRLLSSLADLCLRLRALPVVLVARVNGTAIGGGCGLTTVCDFAVTHADAKLGFPEVDLGVCPAVVAPWLVRKVGPGRARMILLRGGLVTGARAAELGLVTRAVPSAEELDGAVDELAGSLAAGGPEAMRATKALLNELDGSLDAAIARRAAELSASVIALPETQALLRARVNA